LSRKLSVTTGKATLKRRHIYWIETQMLRPLTADRMRFDDRDEADFLNEEGQLRHDLSVEAE